MATMAAAVVVAVTTIAPIRVAFAGSSSPRASVWVGRSGLEEITRLRLDGRRDARIDACCEPRAMAVDESEVWATTDDETVLRVDRADDVVTATIDVGGSPGALAIAPDGVWVAIDGSELVRIDPATNTVVGRTTIGSEGAPIVDIDVGAGAVWVVTDFEFALVQVDPTTGGVLARLPLCPATECRVGAASTSAGVADGAVWLVDATANELLEIDPVGVEIRDRVSLGPGRWTLATGSGGLWLLDRDRGRLVRRDPENPAVRRPASESFDSPEQLTVGGGSIWLYERGTSDIVRLRPRDLEVVDRTSMVRVRTMAVG